MMYRRLIRLLVVTGLIFFVLFMSACRERQCEGCPEIILQLPALDPTLDQSVTVRVYQSEEDAIECSWGQATEGTAVVWTCTPDKNGTSGGRAGGETSFYYTSNSTRRDWTIELTGPSGSATISSTPTPDLTDAWPVGCTCSADYLDITIDDLKSVGAVFPEVPEVGDAGPDAN
jgi:hypothetical protein